MPKLQRIKRANGSLVFSVNFPLDLIESLEWEKGLELDVEIGKVRGRNILVVSKKDDDSVPEEDVYDSILSKLEEKDGTYN